MTALDFLIGRKITEIRYGLGLRVVFDAGERVEPALYADLGPFEFAADGEEPHLIDPARPASVGPALSLVEKTVAQAIAQEDGTLDLQFVGGGHLSCPPQENVEAWQVVGGSPEYLVVCVRPGHVSVFDSEPRDFG